MDVVLRVGEVSETVTVQSNAAVLQTDSGEVRHQLDSTDLSKIPVPVGRNYQSLLSTMPGFTPPTNNHSVGTNPSRALYFAVNGGDHYQNNTRIDGATTMNVWLPDIVADGSDPRIHRHGQCLDQQFRCGNGLHRGREHRSADQERREPDSTAPFSKTTRITTSRPGLSSCLPISKRANWFSTSSAAPLGGRIVKDQLFYFLKL